MDSTAVGLSFIRLLSLSFHFCYALHTRIRWTCLSVVTVI